MNQIQKKVQIQYDKFFFASLWCNISTNHNGLLQDFAAECFKDGMERLLTDIDRDLQYFSCFGVTCDLIASA